MPQNVTEESPRELMISTNSSVKYYAHFTLIFLVGGFLHPTMTLYESINLSLRGVYNTAGAMRPFVLPVPSSPSNVR